ncbi:MAG: hypothetical protein ACLVLC_09215 [Finegoldia magna]
MKGSLFASVVRVFSMKFHKMINVYKNVYAFITPSEFLKKKLSLNGFEEKRIHCIPTFTASKTTIGNSRLDRMDYISDVLLKKRELKLL